MKENGHSTPSMVSDGNNVYAYFHDLALLSFTYDGKERWRVPLGPFNSPYGLASSLTFADGMVFLWIDLQDESLLRAYDAGSGRVRWTAHQEPQTGGGYATPIVYRPAKGPAQLIVLGSGETVGYQIATGERLWWAHGLTAGATASPVASNDMLFVVAMKEPAPTWSEVAEFDVKKDGRIPIESMELDKPMNVAWKRLFISLDKRFGNGDGILTKEEWDRGAAALAAGGGLTALPLNGKADVTETVRWRYTKGLPYYASPLVYRGVLYMIKDGGILSAFNPADGTLHKQARLPDGIGQYWASPIAADGRLFFIDNDGKLTVARAGEQWEALATTDLGEKVAATPALAGGRLFVRSEKHLFCFGGR